MAINGCQQKFADLAQNELPKLMAEMQSAIATATPMNDFLKPKQGVKTLLRNHRRKADFSGCYVLIEHGKPLYVGISRQVFRRLWHHGRGTKHFSATLAYSMAAHGFVSVLSRNERMEDEEFLNLFQLSKERIQKCHFAFVEIQNDLILYLFEAYCAMELDTYEWNTFKTH